jgi:hypothetical protein
MNRVCDLRKMSSRLNVKRLAENETYPGANLRGAVVVGWVRHKTHRRNCDELIPSDSAFGLCP